MALLNSNLHVNRPLSDLVLEYVPSRDGFLRDKFFKRKIVSHLSDQVRAISRDQSLRLYPMITGAGGSIAQIQFGTDATQTYNCTTFALEAALDNLERQNADSELAYDKRQLQAPLNALSLGLEKVAVTDTLRSTSNLTKNTTLSGATYWSNYNSPSSDPIDDLMVACQSVMTNTGRKANVLAMDVMVWKKLAQHPNVLSRSPVHVAGSSGAIMTPKLLEEILSTWLEPGSIQITAQRYNGTAEVASGAGSIKSFIGPDVIVAFADDPSLSTYGVGFEFAFNGLVGSDPFMVLQYQDLKRGPLGSDVLRLVAAVDYKILNDKAAYYIKNAVDSSLSEFSSQL